MFDVIDESDADDDAWCRGCGRSALRHEIKVGDVKVSADFVISIGYSLPGWRTVRMSDGQQLPVCPACTRRLFCRMEFPLDCEWLDVAFGEDVRPEMRLRAGAPCAPAAPGTRCSFAWLPAARRRVAAPRRGVFAPPFTACDPLSDLRWCEPIPGELGP